MIKSFFKSREWALWAWGGLLILLTSVSTQVYLDVLFNQWYRDFYDLLDNAQERDVSEFWDSIIRFFQLAFTFITIAVFSSFFARHWVFRWRQAMTFAYIPLWAELDKEIEGSSQRIQEDTQRFARIVESLGLELFESVLKVFAFVAILWGLSEHVAVPVLSDIPGSLVLLSVGCSIGGMLISYFVGIKLPGLEYNNQKVEAAFRKTLVYAEDKKEHASVHTMMSLFLPIRTNYFRLFLHYGYFDIWRVFYFQTMILVPFIATGPGLFTGAITLGVVTQVSDAFRRVVESFSYFIRSWTTITEFLSVLKRLREFELAIGYRADGKQTAEEVQQVT